MLFIPEGKYVVLIVVLGMIGKCVLCHYAVIMPLCRYYVIMSLLCYYVVIMFSTNAFNKRTVI
jgi:hypothetical protein